MTSVKLQIAILFKPNADFGALLQVVLNLGQYLSTELESSLQSLSRSPCDLALFMSFLFQW